MSCSKLTLVLLFLLLIFKFNYCVPCPKIDKKALLSFKHYLEDPSYILTSWNPHVEVDCCSWEGVVCSNLTGHVHQLDLQNQGLQGKLNPSLHNLRHLRYLDLSLNDFYEKIPSFFGSFTRLEHLNLSYAGFHGRIPHDIGNLSSLHTLSLEDNGGLLEVDSLEWLSGLSRLERLNMNYVNLSKSGNWVEVINTLPSLVELNFFSCSLNFIGPIDDVNVTSLTFVDLSSNSFFSVIPRWIFQLSALVFLDLRDSNFQGPIPSSSNNTKLQQIYLSLNDLNSTFPDWLYSCTHLEFLHLYSNSLQSTISPSIQNLTSLTNLDLSQNELYGNIPREICTLCKMIQLDLSSNKLEGEISDSFGDIHDCFLENLEFLSLSRNQLSGQITNQFGKFRSLQRLGLSNNKLSGNLPQSMGQLLNLESLAIKDNKLEGIVTESHFANLTKLEFLYASGNHLTLNVSRNWIPPFNLVSLLLRSWNFGAAGSSIPPWIQLQKNIQILDLSDTGISGIVPRWFWGIRFLNLSHNQLHGKIPDFYGTAGQSVYLSSNQYKGSLPRVSDEVSELDLSNNSLSGGLSHFLCYTNESNGLGVLHLGENQLTGEVPDCLMEWTSLRYLNLGNNKLFGSIPKSIGFLTSLQSLNLYGNKFSGQIPFSMHKCTKLVKIDLTGNNLGGKMPTWMGTSLPTLRFLILRSNKFSGRISSNICYLNFLQILDLSNNIFSGQIPRCLDNFTAMASKKSSAQNWELDYSYNEEGFVIESAPIATKGREYQYDTTLWLVTNMDLSNNNLSGEIPNGLTSLVELRSLNLSGNHLTGLIPFNIGDMKQMESLDLSRNSLYGKIPNSFARMSSLNYLNLSYNYFTGRIPESTQIMGMNATSFIGNHLCGPPLPTNCRHDEGGLQKEYKGSKKPEIDWFYVVLSLGYAVGLSGVCAVMVLSKTWREACFGMLEFAWEKLYVYFHCKWEKLRRGRVV